MNLITRDELRAKLDRGDEFKLVMTLSGFAYRTKHIPSSLHFETVEEALAGLDREDEIVVYCADVHCAASIYAYRLLEREGFTRVRRYAGGVADWEEAGYPLEGHTQGRAQPQARTPRNRARLNRLCVRLRMITGRSGMRRPPNIAERLTHEAVVARAGVAPPPQEIQSQ